jgi:NAD(P)H-dependent flavin oxidoreductase YrpB (nitropropane dioxygenase family)
MLQTRFCERFGVAAPIVVAPMGPDLTGPELVAAVSNAGGFGILQAQLCPPPLLRDQIRYLRTLSDKPFGVNFVLHFPHHAGIQVCIAETPWNASSTTDISEELFSYDPATTRNNFDFQQALLRPRLLSFYWSAFHRGQLSRCLIQDGVNRTLT